MTCVHGLLRGVDEESAKVAIRLQLQDAELYASSSKGKGREGEESDESLAFKLQTQELENFPLFRADNQMARSMASAVYADGPLVAEFQSQEEAATGDHGIASQWNDGRNSTDAVNSEGNADEETAFDDELLEKLRVLYISGIEDLEGQNDGKADSPDGVEAESSTWAAGRAFDPSTMDRQCEACREELKFFDIARLPCRHELCRTCLGELFAASMVDESLFPPRCCRQRIIMSNVRMFLEPELVRSFQEKRVELETPNRTYWHSPRCSIFIHPCHIDNDKATCPECALTTCTICKGAAHEGDCPNDTILQQVLDTASENGWQRCYNCLRIVELDHGCYHMTCLCRAEFCYLCGQRWKSCRCELWEDYHLLNRANQMVDRDHGDMAALPEQDARRAALVAEAARNLVENHECDHDHWRWVGGPHTCEECAHRLPQYIFECRQCRLQACNRCRRHRL